MPRPAPTIPTGVMRHVPNDHQDRIESCINKIEPCIKRKRPPHKREPQRDDATKRRQALCGTMIARTVPSVRAFYRGVHGLAQLAARSAFDVSASGLPSAAA